MCKTVILALKIYDKQAYVLTTTSFLTREDGKRIQIHDFYVRERSVFRTRSVLKY